MERIRDLHHAAADQFCTSQALEEVEKSCGCFEFLVHALQVLVFLGLQFIYRWLQLRVFRNTIECCCRTYLMAVIGLFDSKFCAV
jgi:hypothetical protein